MRRPQYSSARPGIAAAAPPSAACPRSRSRCWWRDRSGATADFILERADKAHTVAALAPDAVLCTDGGGALRAAARQLGVEHHALNLSKGQRVLGAWHIQNANAYHGRLKGWMCRFKGVASSYLANYLGWFRALDRSAQTPGKPAPFLTMAVGT